MNIPIMEFIFMNVTINLLEQCCQSTSFSHITYSFQHILSSVWHSYHVDSTSVCRAPMCGNVTDTAYCRTAVILETWILLSTGIWFCKTHSCLFTRSLACLCSNMSTSTQHNPYTKSQQRGFAKVCDTKRNAGSSGQ